MCTAHPMAQERTAPMAAPLLRARTLGRSNKPKHRRGSLKTCPRTKPTLVASSTRSPSVQSQVLAVVVRTPSPARPEGYPTPILHITITTISTSRKLRSLTPTTLLGERRRVQNHRGSPHRRHHSRTPSPRRRLTIPLSPPLPNKTCTPLVRHAPLSSQVSLRAPPTSPVSVSAADLEGKTVRLAYFWHVEEMHEFMYIPLFITACSLDRMYTPYPRCTGARCCYYRTCLFPMTF